MSVSSPTVGTVAMGSNLKRDARLRKPFAVTVGDEAALTRRPQPVTVCCQTQVVAYRIPKEELIRCLSSEVLPPLAPLPSLSPRLHLCVRVHCGGRWGVERTLAVIGTGGPV
eukprot:98724-Pyramimonas_sp.AAC.1